MSANKPERYPNKTIFELFGLPEVSIDFLKDLFKNNMNDVVTGIDGIPILISEAIEIIQYAQEKTVKEIMREQHATQTEETIPYN